MIESITTYDQDLPLQASVLKLTGTVILADPQAKIHFAKIDLIPKLLFVVSKQNDNLQFALKTLANMLKSSLSNSTLFIESGGAALVIQLLRKQNPEVVKETCNLLANLFSVCPDEASASIQGNRFVDDSFAILPNSEISVQESVMKMISSFLRNPSNVQYVVPDPNNKSLVSSSKYLQTFHLDLIKLVQMLINLTTK